MISEKVCRNGFLRTFENAQECGSRKSVGKSMLLLNELIINKGTIKLVN